jgi:hypothetical protein
VCGCENAVSGRTKAAVGSPRRLCHLSSEFSKN